MHSMKKRLCSALLLLCLCVSMLLFTSNGAAAWNLIAQRRTTLKLWYTDEDLTDYLNKESVLFNEGQRRSRLEIRLVGAAELLEKISKASLEGKDFPDLYIITNDLIEKAVLSGLSSDFCATDPVINKALFPETALRAVRYQEKAVAYPYYYDTSALLYNKTYLDQMIRDEIENRKLQEHPEAQPGDPVLEVTQEELEDQEKKMLPHQISDILSFARNYNAPDEVEAVFEWDINDIFYNYFFVGKYLHACGKDGDQRKKLDLYNDQVISCMKIYQELSQFFAIDPSLVNYEKVSQDFLSGKIVFTVATPDMLTKIRKAQEEGDCSYAFGVAGIPALNKELGTRNMSVTSCLVINGYSENPEAAGRCADFLVKQESEEMFDSAGKLPVKRGLVYRDTNLQEFFSVYENSVPLPKSMESGDLWVRLERAFTQIWKGAEVNETLRQLSEEMKRQMTGKEVQEKKIPDPPTVSILHDLEEE